MRNENAASLLLEDMVHIVTTIFKRVLMDLSVSINSYAIYVTVATVVDSVRLRVLVYMQHRMIYSESRKRERDRETEMDR
jgi:hypothetical protein